ncbi:hypothetical protein GCM10027047_04960 [Rhodococcus aerolatus]
MRGAVVGLVLGVLAALVVVVGARTVVGGTRLAEQRTFSVCLAPTGSGVCVERWERPELLVVPGLKQVRVLAVQGGVPVGGRYLAVDDPFGTADATAELGPAGDVVVRTADGRLGLTFSAASVASLLS